MAKTLLESMIAESEERAVPAKGKTAAFISSHRAEIEEILAQGHDIKTIWQNLSKDGSIDCNYAYFWKMMRKHFPGHFTPKVKLPEAKPVVIKTPPMMAAPKPDAAALDYNQTSSPINSAAIAADPAKPVATGPATFELGNGWENRTFTTHSTSESANMKHEQNMATFTPTKDDPLMVLSMMKRHLLEAFNETLEKNLSSFLNEIEAASKKSAENNKARTQEFMQAALETSKRQVEEVLQKGTNSLPNTVKETLRKEIIEQVGTLLYNVDKMVKIVIWTAVALLCVAVAAFWFAFHPR